MTLWVFLFGPDVTIIEYGTLSAKGRLLVNSLYSCHLHNVTAKCTCKDLF